MSETNPRSWVETVDEVRRFDERLADEVTEHFLKMGCALSGLITKIIYKKENN